MKRPLTFIDDVFPIMVRIWNFIRYSTIPVLFIIIGLIFSFPWQYYAITVGGYFIIFVTVRTVRYLIIKIMCKAAEASEKRKH